MPRPRPKPDRRRALELLAASHDGCTEPIMAAHGYSVELTGRASPLRAGERDTRARGRGQARDADHAGANHRGGAAGAGRGTMTKERRVYAATRADAMAAFAESWWRRQ
jgi:hypothetical protein